MLTVRVKDKKIDTETVILINLVYGIVITPYNIFQFIGGKQTLDDVLRPYKKFFEDLVKPVFTSTLMFILIISFVISVFLPETLYDLLLLYPEDILTLNSYSLVTHGFLHANVGHLLGNLLILFIFGRIVEKQFGAVKTAFVYFSALIIAALFHGLINILFFETNTGAVGASGAIMGLVSTAILLKPLTISYGLLIPLPVIVIGWLAIGADISGVLQGLDDNIGRFAHIGGFFSIFAVIPFLNREDKRKIKRGFMLNLFTLAAFIVVVFINYLLYIY